VQATFAPVKADLLSPPLCRVLGIEVPIVQAPIGSASTPELAAAVCNAGGLGVLGLTWTDGGEAAARISRTRRLTEHPFGVNLGLSFPIRDQLDAALLAGVRVVSTFWGDPRPVHDNIADGGALHLHTVGTASEARRAVDAGVDVVVAQGWESGGHVWGTIATMALVPAVVDAVDPVPVIAAGGISDGRGLLAALMLGAQAVWMGTQFLAALEANIHATYRHRIVDAHAEDAVYTTCFDGGWPDASHRVLRNRVLTEWEQAGQPLTPNRPAEGTRVARDRSGRDYWLYDDMPPLAELAGEVEQMANYAGQSVGLVRNTASAGAIVTAIMRQARSGIEGEPAQG
jgi:NAD(P)H-dependent flavin oxidoreductase YrpB (nitropropane dioxygenase family)